MKKSKKQYAENSFVNLNKTIRKLITSLFTIILILLQSLLVMGQYPNPNDFHTGGDGLGGFLPHHALDLKWDVALSSGGVMPSSAAYGPATVVSNPSCIPGNWYDPINDPVNGNVFTNSAWISYDYGGSCANDQTGSNVELYFRTSFDLPSLGPCGGNIADNFCFAMDFMADNVVMDIYLNGILKFNSNITGSYVGFQYHNREDLIICDDWVTGTNELLVVIGSPSGYTGFLAQARTPSITGSPTDPICIARNEIDLVLPAPAYSATISVADIDAGSYSPCNGINMSIDKTTFDCSDLGVQYVTLRVEDADDPSYFTECITRVNVIPEGFICQTQDITAYLDVNGLVDLDGAMIDNGSVTPCGTINYTVAPSTLSCDDLGNNTVELFGFCPATVTVVDTLAPICNTQDVTVFLDENGEATISASDLEDPDICSPNGMIAILNLYNFTCNPNPVANVGIRVLYGGTPPYVNIDWVDANGNIVPDNSTSTTNDSLTSPELSNGNYTLQVEDSNGCILIDSFTVNIGNILTSEYIIHPSIGQADGRITIQTNHNQFSTNYLWSSGQMTSDINNLSAGNYSVTITNGSCQSVRNFTLTEGSQDDAFEDPNFVDKQFIVNGSQNSSIPGFSDNCGIQSIALSNDKFTCQDVGAIQQVLVTVTDISGNTSECMSNVTVSDTLAPTCNTTADLIFQLSQNLCDTIVIFDLPIATDNCNANPLSLPIAGQPVSGDVFPVGVTTIQYMVDDQGGNTAICSFDIEVLDFETTAIACNDRINLSLDPNSCSGSILPTMVLQGDNYGCTDSCTVEIRDINGNTVANLFDINHVGKTYTYEVCCGINCCWGEVNVEYKASPIIECATSLEVMACSVAGVDIDNLPKPTVVNNNCGTIEWILLDQQVINNDSCDPVDVIATINSTWQAKNQFGSLSNICTQGIDIKRIPAGEITFPPNYTSNVCTQDTDPSVTGVPIVCSGGEIEFVDSGQNLGGTNSKDSALADFDNNGTIDAFPVSFGSNKVVWSNTGGGVFIDSGNNLGVSVGAAITIGESIDFGDFNNDGFIDVIEVSCCDKNYIWTNDGTGTFVGLGPGLGGNNNTSSVAVGDLNGDGWDDAFLATAGGTFENQVWLNDGAGTLINSGQLLGNSRSYSVELGDLNGDGHLDAFVANINAQPNRVWINNGLGVFTATPQLIGANQSLNVEIGDLDGDGDLDAVVAGPSSESIWINDGTGNFNLGTGVPWSGSPIDVELGDLDNDGDLDVVTNSDGIWLNDGTGNFSIAAVSFPVGVASGVELADLDNDGDLDVYLAVQNTGDKVWINNSRPEVCITLDPDNIPTDLCNLMVSYEDHPIGEDNCHRQFLRMWTVAEWWCGGVTTPTQYGQVIEINDLTPPSITCTTDITVSTDGGYGNCEATLILPAAMVSDDCNSTLEVNIIGGPEVLFSNGGEITLPTGKTILSYVAYDGCYNSSSCQVEVTVEDVTRPTVLCDQNTAVSLTASGTQEVLAVAFDDGSFDDCALDRFEVRRMDTTCDVDGDLFGPTVRFCCLDVGNDSLMVVLRAYDISGNYNDCMVNVEVQDKDPATLTCPSNQIIECTTPYDINNLSIQFGSASVTDNCADQPITETVTSNIDNCGLGNIRRTFSINDGVNGTVSCTQVITVRNPDPFDGYDSADLIWPADYSTTSMCDLTDAHPDMLPAGFGYPAISEDACDLIGVDFEDQDFSFANDSSACFKILRTWTVIDWCQRRADGTYLTWSHVQEIKINNEIAPTIPNNQPGLDALVESLSVSPNGDCLGATANLVLSATDDCINNTPLNYIYTIYKWEEATMSYSELISSGTSNDATAEYAVGLYRVNWIVFDGCGNEASYTHQFEVVNNKPPVAICLDGLSTALTLMDTVGDNIGDTNMVEIWASDIDYGSYHSCYPQSSLTLAISSEVSTTPNVFSTNLAFTTAGMNIPVSLMVTDQNGNTSICHSHLSIEDNEPRAFVDIQGEIKTEDAERISTVEVSMLGAGEEDMTQDLGEYAFADMPVGGDYTIDPSKNTDVMNGVSTLDLVLIQKHILQTQLLDSPYKHIAADINHDERISALDLIQLRKLILGIYEEFPDNESWRFVDGLYSFPEGIDPLELSFPEDYSIQDLNTNMWIDFVGVKIGDVNGSVIANTNEEISETRSNEILELSYLESVKQSTEEITISFTGKNFTDIAGLQFALEHKGLELQRIESGILNINESNIGIVNTDISKLSWNSDKDELISASTDDILFSLVFKTSELRKYYSSLSLNKIALTSEAYRGNQLETVSVILNNSVKEVEHGLAIHLYQNEPNPWSNTTSITVSASQASNAQLIIQDVLGKTVLVKDISLNKGENILQLSNADIPISGIYNYSIFQNGTLISKQMIKI